jgi:predicted DsbA family dithiol-disulfide isomerase
MFSNQKDLRPERLLQGATEIGLQRQSFATCLTDTRHASKVREMTDRARQFGVVGTPTFFVGRREAESKVRVTETITGIQDVSKIEQSILRVLGR